MRATTEGCSRVAATEDPHRIHTAQAYAAVAAAAVAAAAAAVAAGGSSQTEIESACVYKPIQADAKSWFLATLGLSAVLEITRTTLGPRGFMRCLLSSAQIGTYTHHMLSATIGFNRHDEMDCVCVQTYSSGCEILVSRYPRTQRGSRDHSDHAGPERIHAMPSKLCANRHVYTSYALLGTFLIFYLDSA